MLHQYGLTTPGGGGKGGGEANMAFSPRCDQIKEGAPGKALGVVLRDVQRHVHLCCSELTGGSNVCVDAARRPGGRQNGSWVLSYDP